MLSRKGFTLIELLVVIIIVGILASVAVPMMKGNVDRAKKTEAMSMLGMLRTAERLYYAEFNNYLPVFSGGPDTTNLAALSIIAAEMDGVFFSAECYNVSQSGSDWQFMCIPAESVRVPRAAEVNTGMGNIIMFENGTTSGY